MVTVGNYPVFVCHGCILITFRHNHGYVWLLSGIIMGVSILLGIVLGILAAVLFSR